MLLKLKKYIYCLLILFLLIMVGSCSNLFSEKTRNGQSGKASLRISCGNVSRTALPITLEENLTNLILYGMNNTEAIKLGEWSSFTDAEQSNVSIDSGLWSFILLAKDGCINYFGIIENISVEEDSECELIFNLHPGKVEITSSGVNIANPIEQSDKTGFVELIFDIKNKDFTNYIRISAVDLNGETITSVTPVLYELTDTDKNSTDPIKIKIQIPEGNFYVVADLFYDKACRVEVLEHVESAVVISDAISRAFVEINSTLSVYQVQYELNGGSWDIGYEPPAGYTKYSVLPGSDVLISKDNHFEGWYTDPELTHRAKAITSNTTLYAKWRRGRSTKFTIEIQNNPDQNFIYSVNNFNARFGINDYNGTPDYVKWYVDNQLVETNEGFFSFYPDRFTNETYTITAVYDNGRKSQTAFVNTSIPIDYKISSSEFYELANRLSSEVPYYSEYNEYDYYYCSIEFTDKNPDLYEIARALEASPHVYYYLDFSNCSELKELPQKVLISGTSDEYINLFSERYNIEGLRFPGGIQIKSQSLCNMNSLYYLIFEDGDNYIEVMAATNSKRLEYISFGDGNNTIKPACFEATSLMYVYIGNGNLTAEENSFWADSRTAGNAVLHIGKGDMNLRSNSVGNSFKKVYKDDGNTILSGAIAGLSLEEIYLGNGDVDIASGGFHASKVIKKFSMGDGTLKVGYGIGGTNGCSFWNSSLEEFNFGNGDKDLGAAAFCHTKLEYIDLKNGNVTARTPAFGENVNLKSFRMGDGDYIEIGNTTIYANPLLEEIIFGNGTHFFSATSFYQNPSLKRIILGDGDTTFGSTCSVENKALESVKVGKGKVSVGSNSFNGCVSLKTFEAEDGISKIDNAAFLNCELLENIRINADCSEIGEAAFINCTNITFTVDSGNRYFSTYDDGKGLMNYDKTELYYWNAEGDIELPDGAEIKNASLFSNNTKITSVTIPESYTEFRSSYISSSPSCTSIILKDTENWYYTSSLENAVAKTNGMKVEVNGEELYQLLTNYSQSKAPVYLYKVEDSND